MKLTDEELKWMDAFVNQQEAASVANNYPMVADHLSSIKRLIAEVKEYRELQEKLNNEADWKAKDAYIE